MVDGWRGDDWFHNGVFRMTNIAYIAHQTTAHGSGQSLPTGVYDDYEGVLRAGSTADYARQFGLDKLNFTRKLFEHPAYDSYWQQQAVDKILAQRPLKVPTMTVVGYWDQEDIYGAYAVYAALEAKDTDNRRNFLVVGPAPQRRELRWLQSGRVQIHRRYGTGIPPRRDAALPRPVSERWRARGRYAARAVLPEWRQSLAALAALAAGLRAGLRCTAASAVSAGRL
jgi:hypothetical protein